MEINEYLIKLIRIMKEMEGLDLFSDAARLTRTEFRMIREVLIERENGREIISSELARRLGITRSAVSQTVSKLEERGIVLRVPAPGDKKIAYIRLSEHSLAVFEEQCRQANAVLDAVVERLGEKKMQKLLSLYEEFSEALKAVKQDISLKNA